MKLEMSLKKNVVGDLKFWKYFRTRFAGTHPPRLLVSPDSHWLQRQKSLVILMGHQKMLKIWDVRIQDIGEFAETRPGGFSLALYSLLRIDTSFFGCGLLCVPYVPYGV